ncbi:MAG: polyphenol oxidase family protein [Acidimicrobiales bacterium]
MPESVTAKVETGGLSCEITVGDLPGKVVITTRRAGDLRPGIRGAALRRATVVPGPPWAWTRQVHGAVVVTAERAGEVGDGLVGRDPSARPAMFAADCALVGIVSPQGVVGVAHAGWHGLCSGVIEETARMMKSLGATSLAAVRGPCIGPECYEFGLDDLDTVAREYGPTVRSQTSGGRPALDLAAGVRLACDRAEIEIVHEVGSCTACAWTADGEPTWFSHRARRDRGRHALVIVERQ